MQSLKAGLAYLAPPFAAGSVLGPIRVLWLEPAIGPLAAELCEAPFMMAAVLLSARWAVGRFAAGRTARGRLAIGLWAFALLMLLEAAGAVLAHGRTAAEWLSHFATPPGLLSLAMFLALAAAPLLVSRLRRRGDRSPPRPDSPARP